MRRRKWRSRRYFNFLSLVIVTQNFHFYSNDFSLWHGVPFLRFWLKCDLYIMFIKSVYVSCIDFWILYCQIQHAIQFKYFIFCRPVLLFIWIYKLVHEFSNRFFANFILCFTCYWFCKRLYSFGHWLHLEYFY